MSAPSVEGAVTAPSAVAFALPGADHLWWLPDPSEVADLIMDFTEEHSR